MYGRETKTVNYKKLEILYGLSYSASESQECCLGWTEANLLYVQRTWHMVERERP